MSFLDLITPSDIAFVICIIKNARHVWDQTIRKIGLVEPVIDGETEAKVQPLYTKGAGKKKEQGKSLWSDEGMKYYKRKEKVWRKVYKDDTIMEDLYWGFNKWLNTYGREIIASKTSSKSLYLVLARWMAKDNEDNNSLGGTEEVESNIGSDDDEEEGYFSDKGNNTRSIVFAKDRERMKRQGFEVNSDENSDDRVNLMNERRKRRDDTQDERDGDDVNNNSKRRRNKAGVDSRELGQGSNDDESTVMQGRRENREKGVDSPATNTRGCSNKRN